MKPLSVVQKKAYVAKSRQNNYRASLRLEGFSCIPSKADTAATDPQRRKAAILAKYRTQSR